MHASAIEIVKVGGSLLSRSDFVPALKSWLAQARLSEPGKHFVLLVGGGQLVNELRRLNDCHPLPESTAHWLAIDLMEIAGRTVASWMPEMNLSRDWVELQRLVTEPGATLVTAGDFLRCYESNLPGQKLPIGWQATSDSIAARMAICLGATSLTLLKSIAPTAQQQTDLDEAARTGLVDPCLPALAKALEVRLSVLPDMSAEAR